MTKHPRVEMELGRGVTCDVCGRTGRRGNRIYSIFGRTWIKLHGRCLAWASISSYALTEKTKIGTVKKS